MNEGQDMTGNLDQNNSEVVKEVTNMKSNDSNKIIMIIGGVIIFIFLLAVIGLSYFVIKNSVLGSKDAIADSCDLKTLCTSEQCSACTESDEEKAQANNTEGYRYTIGQDGYIDIPAGWKVIGTKVDYTTLTQEEQVKYIKEENIGSWTLFNNFVIEIANNTGSVKIGERLLFLPAATGCMSEELNTDYTFIAVPNLEVDSDNSEIIGFARRKVDNIYTYTHVYEDKEKVFSSNGMLDGNSCGLGGYIFEYSGSEENLTVVDDLFLKSCFRGSSKLCRF